MRILVTGGAGFIGSHVVESLRERDHEVRVLDVEPSTEGLVGDVRDHETVARCVADTDVVVHQAAKVGLGVNVLDLPDYTSVNALGTAVLLAEMARAGVQRIVLASSMVVYGEGAYDCAEHGRVRPGPREVEDLAAGRFEPRCPECGAALAQGTVRETAPLDPRNVYAASKVAQEHLVSSWTRSTGGTAVMLRYHNVYGPRMPRDTPYAGVAAIFRSSLERGEPPRVFEDGGQLRDFVHVRDVAQANVQAAEAAISGVYNIASGEPRTVGDMAIALAKEYAGPDPVVTGDFRLGDVRHIVASPDRAATELGFRSAISFADGMAEFAGSGAER